MATIYSLVCFGGSSGKTFTASSSSGLLLTITSSPTSHGIRAGYPIPVQFTSSGTLPTGLSTSTTYWLAYVAATTCYVYDTEANAAAAGATGKVAYTDAGSGTHTMKWDGITDIASYVPAESDLSRWTVGGTEYIFASIDAWNTYHTTTNPANATDAHVCEVAGEFSEPRTSALSITVPSGNNTITSLVSGARSDAFPAGLKGRGYILDVTATLGGGSLFTLSRIGDVVDGIGFKCTISFGVGALVNLNAVLTAARKCFVEGYNTSTPTSGCIMQGVGARVIIDRCITLYGVRGLSLNTFNSGTLVLNNTVSRAATGIGCPSTIANMQGYFYNNISVGNTTNWASGATGIQVASHNAGLSGEAYQTVGGKRITIATTDFSDYANDVYTPAVEGHSSTASPQVENGTAFYGIEADDIADTFRPAYPNSADDVSVSAGSFLTNSSYILTAVGSTDFTACGADSKTTLTIATDDKVTYTAHPFPNGTPVYFSSLTGGTGLSTNTLYYVVSAATNDFKVATSVAGTPVDVTVAYTDATIVDGRFRATGAGSGTGTATTIARYDVGAFEGDLGYGAWPTSDEITFSPLVSGSQIVIFETGTQTEIQRNDTSGTSEVWSGASGTYDYTVMKAGYLPIRVTGQTVSGSATVTVSQVVDPDYVASSGLTWNTNFTADTSTSYLKCNTSSTGRNLYSACIEAWIAQSALANKAFPIQMDGPGGMRLLNGWETRGYSTAGTATSNTTLSYITQCGIVYLDSSSVSKAEWCSLLSAGVPSGKTVKYQQSDGGTTTSAAATGDINQVVQIYGNASYGNFNYRGYLVCKVQAAGYDQAEVDVVSIYGSLGPYFYAFGLTPTANSIATGDPALTITITDHGASPVTWNGKDFSITITDNASPSSGTNIMRELRYNFEAGGTYQGTDAFNWHDLVQANGDAFKTVRGKLYGDSGASLKGVRVVKNDGTTAHPDFTLFTADDGTTYAPPVTANISISGIPNAGAVPTRMQIINSTATGASAWVANTAYAQGDYVKRTTGLGTESTAGLYFRATTGGTSHATTEPTWDTTPGNTTSDGTVTWTCYKVLFYDDDPAATSYTDSYTDGEEFLDGETVELRFAEHNGGTSFKTYRTTTICSSSGFSIAVDADADSVFATLGIDGSNYETTYSPNFVDTYIVLDTNTDFAGTTAYAYYCYTLTTSNGMYLFWDGVTAIDVGNFRVNVDVLDLWFNENTGDFIKQTDNSRIFRSDGQRPALDPTTGGGGIEMNWRTPVYVVSTGGSALTAEESAYLLALPSAAANATAVWSKDLPL